MRERQNEFELVERNKRGKEGKQKRKEDCRVEDRQREFGLGEREDCENNIVVISFMSLFLIAVSGVQFQQPLKFNTINFFPKVRFNPNKQSFTWLATGGGAGLARLHLVKQVKGQGEKSVKAGFPRGFVDTLKEYE